MDGIIKRIKDRRLELGYSFQDLAEKTNMSKSTLQRYETGAIKNVPLDKLEILAKALYVTPAYLMGWEDEIEDKETENYYLNPETRKLAQEVYENPNLRILFDAARDVEPEDIQMAVDMLERFKKTRY